VFALFLWAALRFAGAVFVLFEERIPGGVILLLAIVFIC